MEAIGSNQGEDIATICSDESDDSSSVSSGSSSVSSASESSGDDSPTYRLVRILVLAATALGSLCNIYATSLAANFTASAINAVVLVRTNSRRDYSQSRRVFSSGWWASVIPHFRAVDEKRFVRNFRIPSVLMDEIVSAAEVLPAFSVSSHVSERAETTVHISNWRLSRPATVTDCSELFGVSEGFILRWSTTVYRFIKDVFGHRLWDVGCL